jgi:hypothetical protein
MASKQRYVYGFQYRGNGYGFWDTKEEAEKAISIKRQTEPDSRYRSAGVVHRFEIIKES